MLTSARSILVDSAARLRRSPVAILVALALAELAAATVLAPLGAAAVDWIVRRSGHYAVANVEIVGFVLSPGGLATLVTAGIVIAVTFQLGRAAGLLAAQGRAGHGVSGGIAAFVGAVRRLPRVTELAARQFAIVALHAAPFVAALGGIAWLVLRGVDLYWLVNTRPLRLWVGVACAAPIAIVGAVHVLRRARGWSIALPLCLLGGRMPRAALGEAPALLRGRMPMVIAARVGWFVACGVGGFVLLAAVHMAAEAIMRRELGGLKSTAVAAGVVLLAYGAVATIVSLVATAGDVLVVHSIWRLVDGSAADGSAASARRGPATSNGEPMPRARRMRLMVIAVLGAASIAAAIGVVGLLRSIQQPIHVELTAHRGAAMAAPENTLPAIRAAIALGADRIEIDAMSSADDAVVVFHDTDLRRLANDPRRVADLTFDELRTFDVGAWFDNAFAGERIPTLDEVFDATAGQTPLNIELKVARGEETALAEAVAAIVRSHGAAGGRDADRPSRRAAIVTSLSPRALEAVRLADPSIPIGIIVTASIGDLRRLDVDFLSVDSRLATPDFLARAAGANLPVHVWNVRDADQLTQLALRGVAGVIAPDVATMRARLDELAKLDDIERLLLAARARMVGG